MATYARGLTSQAVNLTHTTHWSECLMYYVANACSNRNLCNWREYIGSLLSPENKLDGAIDKIVFLGSAATINQFNRTIVPYLQNNQETEFYNISLNAYDEAKTSWFGLQTMSLLEWLDGAVAQPASHTARVMGKWENMMLAMHTIPCGIRKRVHLKHLPSEDGFPRSHSELDEISYDKFNPFKEEHWEVK